MMKGADISKCGKYRWMLFRKWGNGPYIMYVGLNPSTADAETDDATIRRLIAFTKSFGYDGFYIVNLFAYRETDPHELVDQYMQGVDIEGFSNTIYWHAISGNCERVVFCWGALGLAKEKSKEIIKLFPGAECFGLTKDGSPKHPLYLSSKTQLIRFK